MVVGCCVIHGLDARPRLASFSFFSRIYFIISFLSLHDNSKIAFSSAGDKSKARWPTLCLGP
jgi:hypothetical protein